MTIDLVPDPVDQERFFPVMNAIQSGSVAAICGDLLAYVVLELHLEDYRVLWTMLLAVAGGILLFIWLLMPETLPDPKSWQGWRELLRDVLPRPTSEGRVGDEKNEQTSYLHAFMLWCKLPPQEDAGDTCASSRDSFGSDARMDGTQPTGPVALQLARLRVLQVTLFVLSIQAFQNGVNMFDTTFLLGPLHFLQEQRISIQIFGKACTVLSIPLSTWLLPQLGPYRALITGQVLSVFSIPLKVLPWCGSQCQAGPYVASMLATVGGALAGPASIMYLAAALKPADLVQAQSALLLLQTVLSNVSPMFWSAFFFGDRASMTTGYMMAMVMCVVALAVMLLHMPRELPRTGVVRREDMIPP